MAKGVLIQPSFYEAMKGLPDGDRLRLFDAICEYGLYSAKPNNLPPMAQGMFLLMQPVIDSSNRRYDACVANGKRGGARTGNKNASKKQPKDSQRTTKIQAGDNQDYESEYEFDFEYDWECATAPQPPPLDSGTIAAHQGGQSVPSNEKLISFSGNYEWVNGQLRRKA